MITLMIVVVLIYSCLARYRGSGKRALRSPGSETQHQIQPQNAGPPGIRIISSDTDVELSQWTALDDLQLRRLLKDSS